MVVERLLSISGEDTLTVNRKYREQWTGKLPTRFMVISNELPQLGDASTAIAGRFVPLLLTRSWLGKEDHGARGRAPAELPGILNWALDGLERLERAGTASPGRRRRRGDHHAAGPRLAGRRLRPRPLRPRPGRTRSPVDELYAAWRSWAEDNGHHASRSRSSAATCAPRHARIRVGQPRDGDERKRVYYGITLKAGGSS